MQLDVKALGVEMGALIAEMVAPLQKRISDLEARQPERGEPGERGRDADPQEVVRALVDTDDLAPVLSMHAAQAVAEYMAEHPVKDGKDGVPGRDGKDGVDGKDGIDGKDGADGKDGRDGERGADGKDGERGERGERGLPGADGAAGQDGRDGADGVGLAGALIDRAGDLVVTLSNGEQRSLGPVVGKDGRDGLNAENFTGEYVAERGFVIHAPGKSGPVEFVLPYYVHRDFWTEGKRIKAGESVTHDGALWIAKRDTVVKPCLEAKEDWALAARKGRDGKDGRNGIDKTAPVNLKGGADA